ncbi:MAG: four helix bundle protein [Verrucomicrobiae bacterium]|nr:four helix bundle protein [Verrucomicrobiae bacterium]
MDERGYRRLEVWKLARELTIEIHEMTLTSLPKFEMFEMGSQIRRSMKSVRSNVVEGFGKRIWKPEFVRHLTYAIGSCDETIDHLETLWETRSLADQDLFTSLSEKLDLLKRKLVRFRQCVQRDHQPLDQQGT